MSRRCTATNKHGQPCRAWALKEQRFCLAHNQEAREAVRFGGAQPNAGRKPLPKPTDVARSLIEQNVLALQRPYWNALGYDVVIGANGPELAERVAGPAKIYGVSAKDGVVYVSEHDDLEAMQRAAERLQDRVYGKPKQQTEITGADGGPVEVAAPLDARERAVKAATLLAAAGQLEPLAVANGNGSNGHGNGNGRH
jgi:hypothetical protein